MDNNTPDIDVRARWVRLAQQFDIPIRCIYFTAPAGLCEHNNTVRALSQAWLARTDEVAKALNPESRTLLPRMAFSIFAKRFVKPEQQEGFQDITRVDFAFNGDAIARQAWGRYWVSS